MIFGLHTFVVFVQLDTLVDSSEPWTPKEIETVDAQFLAHFIQPPPECPAISWLFCPPPSSTNDLYMIPGHQSHDDVPLLPLHCATFDCTTKSFQSIKAPDASKVSGVAVTVGRDIYFLAHPCWYKRASGPFFERYVPAEDKWDEQVPFPDQGIQGLGYDARIVASAVWNDTIVLNMGGCQIWAYNVSNRKWYHVLVEDDKEDEDYDNKKNNNNNQCYAIIDDGVVVNYTLYALSKLSSDSVLALSIKKEEVDSDLQFSCSLRSEIIVPYMTQIKGWRSTRRFVHLGEDNFCLVQSCKSLDSNDYQPIQVTSMKLMGEDKMVVTKVCNHQLFSPEGQFRIGFWFSQPECKTTALKQGETTFFFDPCKGFVSKQEDKTYFNDVEVTSELDNDSSQTNVIDEQGHSILVINLPLEATT